MAATKSHPKLVHPRWKNCPDFWCDAICQRESDLHKCYEQIPKRLLLAPPILDAAVRHPLLCDLRHCSHSNSLLEALLCRVSDRESLRECVRYAQTCDRVWGPNRWSQIPNDLWEDEELCLELLAMMPPLYGCLPARLQSDPDVLAALLVVDPK